MDRLGHPYTAFSLFPSAHRLLYTHARYVVVVAHSLLQQPIPYLPGEDRGTLALVVRYFIYNRRRRDPWLASANGPRLYRARLVVPANKKSYYQRIPRSGAVDGFGFWDSPAQDFGHASVADLQYPRDVAGPRSAVSQLDDLLPGRVGQRSPVDVDPAQLVDSAVTGRGAAEYRALAHHAAAAQAAPVHQVFFWNETFFVMKKRWSRERKISLVFHLVVGKFVRRGPVYITHAWCTSCVDEIRPYWLITQRFGVCVSRRGKYESLAPDENPNFP